jgi:hypothetical protein
MPKLPRVVGPAVASVRAHTASTGAAKGSSHVKSSSTCSASCEEAGGEAGKFCTCGGYRIAGFRHPRDGERDGGGVTSAGEGAVYVAQVTRWMIQQPRKATCHGTIATNNKMRNMDRTVFLVFPA